MKVTFIMPSVGKRPGGKYVRTWQMEPLPIATLAGLTPVDVEVSFFDDRFENINFDLSTDLVAITVEAYTAKRAYEIVREYHQRGVKTVLGGYHVTLRPEEAQRYADSIVIGYAELIWGQVMRDAQAGCLKRRYSQDRSVSYNFVLPRREIFGTRSYFPLSCVETGRGCPFGCNFCSIAAVTSSTYTARSIDSVVEEIALLQNREVFFVEDNFVGNPAHAKDLCRELIPHKIKWVGQGTLTMANDCELLELMARSGCVGILIGFESLRRDTLASMGKKVNIKLGDYKRLIDIIHGYGIALYGTFVFGYGNETKEDIQRTTEAAIDFGLFIGAFNHLVPFPGTPLYEQFQSGGQLTDDEWWLSPSFRFGDIVFRPNGISAEELHKACIEARRKFYSFRSIVRRASNIRGNCSSVKKAGVFAYVNWLLRREITQRDGLPLGEKPTLPEPIY
ncbi:MAG: radical SAM protein [bacterium]|nr:radical SAM protein [bacterium]